MCAVGAAAVANASPYIVTLEEVGPNVVATGSGEIDLTGLTLGQALVASQINPSSAYIFTGATVPPATSIAHVYTATISGPSAYGIGSTTQANDGSGDNVGIIAAANRIYVPEDYVSENPLTDSATYDGATFAILGVTPAPMFGRGEQEPIKASHLKSVLRHYPPRSPSLLAASAR
jgi:hypothetical protein